jgi:regulatory protein
MKYASRRKIKIPTPEKLKNIALHYLGRYAASEASLRQVLERRLLRAAHADSAFAADSEKIAELRRTIESIIAAHRKTGALNDAALAEMKVASLRRSGRSARYIRQKLTQKGVAAGLTQAALTQHDAEDDEAEMKAALAYARRRRLGPHRTKPDPTAAMRDFAALARAGFDASTIKKVLRFDPESRDD